MTEKEFKGKVVGQRVTKIDSLALACGLPSYVEDVVFKNLVYVKMLRSPYAHAKIVNIDTSQAEKLPGVRAIVTGQEIAPVKFGLTKEIRDQYLLAIDKVRYVGEEVAGVAAVDEDIAEEVDLSRRRVGQIIEEIASQMG